MSLGRKQRIDNGAWLDAVATIEEAVSRAELDELTAATVADIKAVTAGKCAAYAWSAGKDSIVLGKLCEAAGVTDSMIGVCDLEYPAFAAWMHRAEDVAALTEDLVYTIRGALNALPGRLAVDVAAVSTPAEASEVIRKEVSKVMRELAGYHYDPKKYEERVRERRDWSERDSDDE